QPVENGIDHHDYPVGSTSKINAGEDDSAGQGWAGIASGQNFAVLYRTAVDGDRASFSVDDSIRVVQGLNRNGYGPGDRALVDQVGDRNTAFAAINHMRTGARQCARASD